MKGCCSPNLVDLYRASASADGFSVWIIGMILRADSTASKRAVQVAQQLGFRSRRRPAGYWDNEDNLDREIAQFVAANWTQMEHPQSEGSYWYNQVSAWSLLSLLT